MSGGHNVLVCPYDRTLTFVPPHLGPGRSSKLPKNVFLLQCIDGHAPPDPQLDRSSAVCAAHNEPLSLFDTHCEKLACESCSQQHSSHTHRPVAEIAGEISQKAQEKLANIQSACDKVDEAIRVLDANRDAAHESISTWLTEIRALVDTREKQLRKQVEDLRKVKIHALEDQKNCLQILKCCTESIRDKAATLEQKNRQATESNEEALEIIDLHAHVRALPQTLALSPVEDSKISFQVESNNVTSILNSSASVQGTCIDKMPPSVEETLARTNQDVAAAANTAIDEALTLLYGLNRARIDRSKAVEVLRAAFDVGNPKAIALTGLIRLTSLQPGTRCPNEIREIFLRALDAGLEAYANANDATAQWLLGFIHEKNIEMQICNSTDSAAMRWYEMAAAQGHAMAQCGLGAVHLNLKDFQQFVDWTTESADQGHALAQFNLSKYYSHNNSGEEALRWCQKSADQGFGQAQVRLGHAHKSGEWGLIKDANRAQIWFQAADNAGAGQKSVLSRLFGVS
eukprot:c2497_g1_i1.p1 GENE.c2497_g1_i1~~c2497_g1_i1.p1  ORF type:complete len:564 (+),score=85.73 c2497_g1_i1:153-1694(+)